MQCTEEKFLKDVSEHEMKVLLDGGVNRCLCFAKRSDSWNMHFTLTTWPGYLCISGDMGCFVFTRLNDMFQFFRTSPDKANLYINPQYWAEKCEAADRRTGGLDEYDADIFKQRVKEHFDEHEFEDEDAQERCWAEIEDQVLTAENESEAFRNAADFTSDGFEFSDFWEHRLRRYTYQYIWCCYAIAWGIRQYDSRSN